MARWAKGQSGNPGGRPRGVGDLRELARRHTGEAVQVLVTVMGDVSAAPSARVGAAQALLDRGWGRAPLSLEVREQRVEVSPDMLRTAEELLGLVTNTESGTENKRDTGISEKVDAASESEAAPTFEGTTH